MCASVVTSSDTPPILEFDEEIADLVVTHPAFADRRGTRLLWRSVQMCRGFLPAQAGNTSKALVTRISMPVHPSAGGEHFNELQSFGENTGSSPRRRGTHISSLACSYNIRFIPAQAGNTCQRTADTKLSPVHPRAGGEHDPLRDSPVRRVGSSPRRRGTHSLPLMWHQISRFIPAQAGNTLRISN
ncbi:Hypothetical protein GbCGDNIH7_1372 [Granulibacter bethesdensis]|nr:Hypothetical protein GbCGDNIH7_1372 [Granulibacter bethesdensis]